MLNERSVHYSLDYTQQIHFPSNLMQPGPIYHENVAFSVSCEGAGRQVNYLIDEASTVGKGANSTISYIHHYMETNGLGETHAYLHADNCTGQNKNNCFLWYFTWRVINELHQSMNYSFLIAGHKICPRPLLWPDQASIQSELYIIALRISKNG